MTHRKQVVLNLLVAVALLVAVVGAVPANASVQTTASNLSQRAQQNKTAHPSKPRPDFGPAKALPKNAPVGPLSHSSGLVNVMIELSGQPAAVVYADQQSSRQSAAQVANVTQAQMSSINQAQMALLQPLQALGATVLYRVQRVYNGIAVRVDSSKLDQIKKLAGVKAIHTLVPKKLDLTTSVPLIGAPQLWNPNGLNATGNGVTIGIIDSGIDYLHADFGGYGAITPTLYISNDTTIVGDVSGYPSIKVAGGHDFVGDSYDADPNNDTYQPIPVPDPDPAACLTGGESADHGTHVAGITAGYGVTTGGNTYTGPYSATLNFTSTFKVGPGVAPGATLYSLRVFGCNGSTDVVTEAIDWAMDPNGDGDFSDHLDVINMSLGSDFGYADDPDAVASDNASLAGVVVVASAGNANDVYYVVGSPSISTRALSVASSRDSGNVLDGFRVDPPSGIAGVYGASQSALFDWSTSVPVTATLVYPTGTSQRLGCSAFNITNTQMISGNIVLLDWDGPNQTCGSITRGNNAVAAGAVGMIIADNASVFSLSINGSPVIPAVSTPKSVGDILKAQLTNHGAFSVTLSNEYQSTVLTDDPAIVDTVSSFSSRGPRLGDTALKPDITAPGDSIFSAYNGTGNEGLNYSGTSMAAPHVAGSMALLRQLHPSWTVEELKALAMDTAFYSLKSDPPAPPATYGAGRVGAGRISLPDAANVQAVAYNAGLPGAVSVSFGAPEIKGVQTAVRRIRVANKSASPITYTVDYTSVVESAGVDFSVSPAQITVPPYDFATVVVTMTADSAAMMHDADPTVDQSGRQFMSESSGYVQFSNGSDVVKLEVPIYAAAHPASDMSAVQSSLTFGTSPVISLTGQDLLTGAPYDSPPDITSLVTPFELQYVGTDYGASGPLAAANLKAVGVTSDYEGQGSVANTEVFFAIAAQGRWSTPSAYDTEYDIRIDTNGDGASDYVLFNYDVGSMGTGADNQFVSVLVNLHTGSAYIEDYLNYFSGDYLDTALYNNNVMVMPVYAADLGLTSASSKFKYYVRTYNREYFGNALPYDETPWLAYDAGKPGLDFTGGYKGIPTWSDLAGDTIQVAYPNLGAYLSSGSKGVLLIHHHNGMDATAEILDVTIRQTFLPLVLK